MPCDAPLGQMTGIHLEGPFLSHLRRGVHPPESLALPTVATLKRFLEAANGSARILTIAPELPGATEVIDSARAARMTVALGHTDATGDEAHTGIAHAARLSVHVFDAMRPCSHLDTCVRGD